MRISDWSSDVCSSDLFYIFGLPTLSDIPTFGMRVNDSTGSPTYHSGLKGLRIVQMVSGDATISVPAGKTYAISPVNPAKSRAITIRSEEHTSELQSLMRISYAVL